MFLIIIYVYYTEIADVLGKLSRRLLNNKITSMKREQVI